jgi:hypothetical protein
MLRPAHYLALLGSLSAIALGGCNSVLGIDEAHSNDDGAMASSVLTIPIVSCQAPSPDCAACVAGTNAYAECLSTQDCRKALDGYRACLGSQCDNAACFDALAATTASKVADVVRTECKQCVGKKPLASICELYCRCMQQPLPPQPPATAPDGETCETWVKAPSAGAACIQACETLAATDPASISCRWSHCELAVGRESRIHCSHAIDFSICPPKVVAGVCKNRSLRSWACLEDKDCCSGSCVNNFCE